MGTKKTTPEQTKEAKVKPEKVKKEAKQKEPAKPRVKKAIPDTLKTEHPVQLHVLKDKLRKKFALLRDEPLNYGNREELLAFVCTTLGMNRPSLDSILIDL